MKEMDLQRLMLARLLGRGIFAWRNSTQAPVKRRLNTVKRGVSDILGILAPSGKLLAIEVKMEGGRVSEEQKAFLHEVNESGGVGFVAYSLDDLDKNLCQYYR